MSARSTLLHSLTRACLFPVPTRQVLAEPQNPQKAVGFLHEISSYCTVVKDNNIIATYTSLLAVALSLFDPV